MKLEQVPLLPVAGLTAHHFGAKAGWKPEPLPLHDVFHINRLETYISHMHFPLPPHRKTVHDFIFLTGGHTHRSKGLDGFDIGRNTFFFLPAYQITTHEYMSPDATGFYCHFDLEMLSAGFAQRAFISTIPFLQVASHPMVHIPGELQSGILAILSRLETEYEGDATDKLVVIQAYLLTLFVELLRFAAPLEQRGHNAAGRLLALYKDALAQHIYQKQTVAAYAELLAVSPNHLNKSVKSVTGKSAQDLLEEMLVLEAKTLLKQSDLNVSEIGYKLGKADHSSFSRFFKTHTGLTPKEYKASC